MRKLHNKSAATEESEIIDMTPQLDFFMNLLVFFIIASLAANSQVLSVSLPSSESHEKEVEKSIVMEVTKDRHIMVGGERLDVRRIAGYVSSSSSSSKQQGVVIAADRDAPAWLITTVIDESKKGGAKRVSIATSKE